MTDTLQNAVPIGTLPIQFVPNAARRVLVAAEVEAVPEGIHRPDGREVWIIVPRAEPAEAALSRFHRVIPCDWSRYIPRDLPTGYFDCIIGENLLELTDHPLQVLNCLAAALREKGLMILAVHNQQYHRYVTALVSGRWIPAGADTIPAPGPLRFYTAASLTSLVLGCPMLDLEVCGALEKDHPDAFPLDTSGMHHRGNMTVGPLSPAEYPQWLTRRHLLVCTRNRVPPKW